MADADLRRAAGFVDGVPERFVPGLMAGQPLAAEHLARYDWAAGFAAGRRVLDAGCGVGYGTALLARAGAREVVGVDSSEDALAVARSALADVTVAWEAADLRRLPYPDASFDLVVCFEVIEHVAEVEEVVAELSRVLSVDGLLVVSTPNRDRNVPGNPHHVGELVPDELHALLARHLPEVRLARQVSFLASGVLDEHELAQPGTLVARPATRVTTTRRPGEELYTIGLAGHRPLPPGPAVIALGDPFEVRRWVELHAEQEAEVHRWAGLHAEQEAEASHQRTEAQRLYAAYDEQRTAARVLQASARAGEERLAAVEARLATVLADPAWRLAAPLRALRRAWARGRS